MMTELFSSIQAWPISQAIAEHPWYFPAAEVVHVMAIALVVGSISLLDLRLVGLRARDIAVTRIARDVLNWTWVAFAVAVVTGLLMFISSAETYWENPFFRIKMVLIALAGLNMLLFHLGMFRSVHLWDDAASPPYGARIAGGLSLLFWIGVVTCGRWIGFV